MRTFLFALLACTCGFGQTYEADLARDRSKYAKTETEALQSENKSVMFSAVDKGNTTLLVIAMNAVWDRESVDSFVNNRKRDWKDYGFKRVAFVYTKGTGKKMTLETYAVFNIKQS